MMANWFFRKTNDEPEKPVGNGAKKSVIPEPALQRRGKTGNEIATKLLNNNIVLDIYKWGFNTVARSHRRW